MTLTGEQVRKYVGRAVFDADHEMVGEVDAVYFSDDTGEPAWVSFHTDFFAERDAFVPVTQIVPTGEGVSIPLPRDVIRSMPRIKPRDGALSSAQVARLHEFLGRSRASISPRLTRVPRSSPTSVTSRTRASRSRAVRTRPPSVPGSRARTSRTT